MGTNQKSKPFLIGVAGGTASGKSTVCEKIMAKLSQDCQRRVALIKQDSFYRDLSPEELSSARKGCFNFDHPDAIDEQAMHQALKNILNGIPVKLPIHDYEENRHKPGEFYEVQSADVVLFEGVLIFYFPTVRDMFHMKLFVDTDSDIRLSRRVIRDVKERGRQLDIVLCQYDQYVKPAFEEFCLPTKKYADMIIPKGADNEVAIGLINHNIIYLLSELGVVGRPSIISTALVNKIYDKQQSDEVVRLLPPRSRSNSYRSSAHMTGPNQTIGSKLSADIKELDPSLD